MNRIRFTSKTTMKLNKRPYKGYNLGEIPPSFGFDAKLDGIDENTYKFFSDNHQSGYYVYN